MGSPVEVQTGCPDQSACIEGRAGAMLMAVDGPATGPSQTATRHRTTRSRKLLSGVVGCEVERQPIEPKNLYDGHRHAVSRRGDNASAADHLWMAGGDRRLKHSILGELAGPSGCRCPRIFRLHAEQVTRTLCERSRLPPGGSYVLSFSARSANMRAWCAFPAVCSKSLFRRPSRLNGALK